MPWEFDRFKHHLDDFDMTDEQKREALHAVWQIMETFVDLAWSVDSTQLVLAERGEIDVVSGGDMIPSSHSIQFFNSHSRGDA